MLKLKAKKAREHCYADNPVPKNEKLSTGKK
jgi:hypothetical protein